MKFCRLFFVSALLLAVLAGSSTAQPFLSINYRTLPEVPVPGEEFVLQIDVVNSGYPIRDAKLTVSEGERDLAIVSDGIRVSYVTIKLGDVTGSAQTSVRLKADRDGIYQVRIKLSYNYGTGSVEEMVPVIVVNKPSMVIEKLIQPVIEPGESGRAVFEVRNGGGVARNVEAVLAAPDGFVAETSRMSFDRWDGGELRNLIFNISAGRDVSVGVYPAKLIFSFNDRLGNAYREETQFAIVVKGNPEISFSGFATTPERVHPDDEFVLTLTVGNNGKDDAKNVLLILNYPGEFSGEKEAFVGTLKRSEEASVSFKLKADREAESGSYPFRLTVKYMDGKEMKERSFDFSLFIDELGSINLEISGLYFSPRKVTPSSEFTLSLQIENSGKQDARAVAVKLILPEGFEGKNQYFIGTLESGDSATSTFDLVAPENAGEYIVKAVITYMDSKLEKYSVEKEFAIYVFPGENNTAGIIALAVLILIAAGGYFWRRKAK